MRPIPSCVVAIVLGAPAMAACGRYLSIDEEPVTGDAPAEPQLAEARLDAASGPPKPSPDDAGASTPAAPEASAPKTPRLAFVTSKVFAAESIEGLSGADLACNAAAASGAPALQGKQFVAWLSDDIQGARERLGKTTGPWDRVDGKRVADDVAQLVGPKPLTNAIDRDEDGDSVDGFAWTGTTKTGTPAYGTTCIGWRSSNGVGVVGALVPESGKWTAAATDGCGGAKKVEDRPHHHLYCFERDP